VTEPETDEIAARAAEAAADVTEAEHPAEQRRLIEKFTRAAASGARAAGRGTRAVQRRAGTIASGSRTARDRARSGTGWLAAQVVAMAPRLRVRDQAALRAQFPGKSDEEIADALIVGASRAAAATGGAVGMWAALPVLPAWPAEIATETLILVGIEIKLVAELHEAFGVPAHGSFAERMTAYVAAWAQRRGVSVMPGAPALLLAAGSPLARLLRRRLAARARRSAFSLGPLLTGAAAGAMLNRRETRNLGAQIKRDLLRRVIDR
jgi:hypothetical protein